MSDIQSTDLPQNPDIDVTLDGFLYKYTQLQLAQHAHISLSYFSYDFL